MTGVCLGSTGIPAAPARVRHQEGGRAWWAVVIVRAQTVEADTELMAEMVDLDRRALESVRQEHLCPANCLTGSGRAVASSCAAGEVSGALIARPRHREHSPARYPRVRSRRVVALSRCAATGHRGAE